MSNQRGSILLLVLPLAAVTAVVASVLVSWFSAHSRMQAYNRVVDDSASVKTTVKMILSNRNACKQSLTSVGIGTKVSELKPDKNISIIRPQLAAGSALTKLMTPGTVYDGVFITKMSFSTPKKVVTTLENSYLSELTVYYRNPRSSVDRSFVMPFYFVADAAGVLQDCSATSYISSAVTTEDFVCNQQYPGSNYMYYPKNQTCGPKTS